MWCRSLWPGCRSKSGAPWSRQVLRRADQPDGGPCGAALQGRQVGLGEPGDRVHALQRQEGAPRLGLAPLIGLAAGPGPGDAVTYACGHKGRRPGRASAAGRGRPSVAVCLADALFRVVSRGVTRRRALPCLPAQAAGLQARHRQTERALRAGRQIAEAAWLAPGQQACGAPPAGPALPDPPDLSALETALRSRALRTVRHWPWLRLLCEGRGNPPAQG